METKNQRIFYNNNLLNLENTIRVNVKNIILWVLSKNESEKNFKNSNRRKKIKFKIILFYNQSKEENYLELLLITFHLSELVENFITVPIKPTLATLGDLLSTVFII